MRAGKDTELPRQDRDQEAGLDQAAVIEGSDGARWWLSPWLPVLFFMFSAGVLLVSWRAFLLSEASAREMETRVTAEQVQLRLEAWIQTRISVVEQMASVWTREYRDHPEAFRKAALDLIELYPGFQALNWIDESWVIRIIVPELSNEAALGKDLKKHPSPGVPAALERATVKAETAVTSVIHLLQGGRGFASYRRIEEEDGHILGYVNGVFRVDTLVDACLAEEGLRRRFHFQLLDENGGVAYSNGFKRDRAEGRHVVSVPIHIGDQVWELRMARSESVPNGKGEALAAVLLAIALLFAAILSMALSALIRSHRQYQESVATFRHLLEHLRDLVIRMDAEGRVLYASPAYLSLLGREQKLEEHDALLFIHGGDRDLRFQTLGKLLEPPHLLSVEQRILSARSWHRISWMLMGIPGEDGSIRMLLALGREEDVDPVLRSDGLD